MELSSEERRTAGREWGINKTLRVFYPPQLFDTKEADKAWSFADFTPTDTGKWTHKYHRYPAKFIPQLVERLFDEYIGNGTAHVNDPFCGCGTTIVTAISRGYKASGTDINRIAHLITRAKSIPIEPDYLAEKIDGFLLAAADSIGNGVEPLIPEGHIERLEHWFAEENMVELGRILRVIYEEDDEVIRNFLLVGFSHILKTCSVWEQGSTKPARNLSKKLAKPYEVLRRHLRRMQNGNEDFYSIVPAKVRKNLPDYLDIRTMDARFQSVSDGSVDLVVSSSPYVTSYEYADLHQLSTIWLDLAEDLKEYRKAFIGTSHKKYEDRRPRSGLALDTVYRMLDRDKRTAKEIEAFFIDMEEVFDENFRILKPGGRCCYVIGDTRLKGVDILNAEIFAESLQHSGFGLDRVIKRKIPSKILPQKRDEKTGKFASNSNASAEAYPSEFIVIGLKESAK
jgi:DNA modification methylase